MDDRTKRTITRGRGGGRWNLANQVVGATADLAARATVSRVKTLLLGGRRILFVDTNVQWMTRLHFYRPVIVKTFIEARVTWLKFFNYRTDAFPYTFTHL